MSTYTAFVPNSGEIEKELEVLQTICQYLEPTTKLDITKRKYTTTHVQVETELMVDEVSNVVEGLKKRGAEVKVKDDRVWIYILRPRAYSLRTQGSSLIVLGLIMFWFWWSYREIFGVGYEILLIKYHN